MFRALACATLLALLAPTASKAVPATPGDIFSQMGTRYGVDPDLLRAIAWKESRWHPWTVNVGGESFYLSSKEEALQVVKRTYSAPWLLVVGQPPYADVSRYLFASRNGALTYTHNNRYYKYKLDFITPGAFDVGIMQIHWRFHNKNAPSLDRLMDPDFNVAYGANYLSQLIHDNGVQKGVGLYHSTDVVRRRSYSADVLAIYNGLRARSRRELASNR